MANKRMFTKEITSSDIFLDMPVSARELYFQLGMNADDDGFVNPKRVMRMIGSPDDDIKILITKGFLIPFSDGVIVITHWKRNNNEIRSDRYKPTLYQEHLKILTSHDNIYALPLECVPNDIPKVCLDKSRVDKSRVDKSRIERESEEKNLPPTPKEKPTLKNLITEQEFIKARGIDILQEFVSHWCEKDKKGNEKRTKEKTRELDLRLAKWKRNKETNFGRNKPKDYTNLENFHTMMMQERVPELKELLGKEKYFEVKELRKQSPFYLTR